MWYEVLSSWFIPQQAGSREDHYKMVDGRLAQSSLSTLMEASANIKDFSLILPDVTVDD
jgi:hypothetical protein